MDTDGGKAERLTTDNGPEVMGAGSAAKRGQRRAEPTDGDATAISRLPSSMGLASMAISYKHMACQQKMSHLLGF